MSALKPGMTVRIEMPQKLTATIIAIDNEDETVHLDGPSHLVGLWIPGSWCKPVLPEVGIGDVVSVKDATLHGVIVGVDGAALRGYTLVLWGADGLAGNPASWAREELTLVSKASYKQVDANGIAIPEPEKVPF